jgi:predicted AlkP superfamily phosphohydrolase/phosphomutase
VFAASEAVDFAASTAYLRSPSELGVRINVAGRDPDGVVPESEYESVREDVIDLLASAETPDGDPVFDEVVPREAYIHGPYADEAVDVLCVPADFEHSLSALLGERFGDPEAWNHKLQGIVAVSGPGVDADANLAGAHLFDVAPTVLATLDLAPADVMDGDPLPAVDAPEPTSYPAYEASEHAATEDTEVAQRLSDLGYLE